MCDCINKINEALVEHNSKLDIPITFNIGAGSLKADKMKISTVKLDTKKRIGPITFFATYCPICGEKYAE